MKLKLPHFLNKDGQKIKLSITFKTALIYSLMFGVILTASVALLTRSFSAREFRTQNLERIASFLSERMAKPDWEQFDYKSFAAANQIYIEIKDMDDGRITSFGERKDDGRRYIQTVRRLNMPMRRMMLRVEDQQSPDFMGDPLPWYLGGIALLTVLTALFGASRTRKMLRPVYAMTRTARSISASDLSARIDAVHSNDELRELAETFNEMLDRIQKSYEQQNRFVSDASHELRTPLSVISGYANLLRRWGSADREVLGESVQKIIEETDNMQQLVDRLLFLARADKNTQHISFERFSLSGLARDIAEETALIDEGHSIRSEIEEGVSLTADSALMKQAVRAMVENSLKYTPAGGSITIICRETGGLAEIGVSDTGIGIAQKDLPHIFDRFYKADSARTRAKGSSGLGLSIVKWIVDRHGGTIRVESKPNTGTKMTILLSKNREE